MRIFELRIKALFFDMLVVVVMMLLLIGFPKISSIVRWVIVFIIVILVFIVPYLFNTGQTIGKKLLNICVIKNTEQMVPNHIEVPSIGLLLLREIVLLTLIIGSSGLYILLAGIISFKNKDARTIHDCLFNTRVISRSQYDKNGDMIKHPDVDAPIHFD